MKIKTNKNISRNLKSKTFGNYMHLGLLTWGNWKWIDQPNGEKKNKKTCRGNTWKQNLKIMLPTCN